MRVFLLWSTLYFFITVDWSNLTLPKLFTTYYSGYGWSGQYFFILLFQFLLLSSFFRFLARNRMIFTISMIVFTVIVTIWTYHLYSFPEYLYKLGNRPFFLYGICVLGGIWMARSGTRLNPLLMLTVFLLPMEIDLARKLGIEIRAIISPVNEWATLFVVGGAMSLEGRFRISPVVESFFHWIGAHTMAIFILNPLIVRLLSPICEPIRNQDFHFYTVLFPFASAILVFSICLGLSWGVQKTPLQRILF